MSQANTIVGHSRLDFVGGYVCVCYNTFFLSENDKSENLFQYVNDTLYNAAETAYYSTKNL